MNSNVDTSVRSFEVPVHELIINKDLMLRAMGYNINSQLNIPGLLCVQLDKLLSEVENHLEIKACFKLFRPYDVKISRAEISLKNKILQSGKIINLQLKQANTLALFSCTLGQKFDTWINKIKLSGDMFITYIADIIGSELIELALDSLEKTMALEIVPFGYKYSNRFSPGYCSWPLMDQHTIFSFLPQNLCNISLNESALMNPIKSVSGIYGLGKSITKKAYQCSICDSTHCYKRVHQ